MTAKISVAKAAAVVVLALLILLGIVQMTYLRHLPHGSALFNAALLVELVNAFLMWKFATASNCWTLYSCATFFIVMMIIGLCFMAYGENITGLSFFTVTGIAKLVFITIGNLVVWGALLTPFRLSRRATALAAARSKF